MQPNTAVVLLSYLARKGILTTRMTTFMVPSVPQPVDLNDIKDAFESLRQRIDAKKGDMHVTVGAGVWVWCREKTFEKLFKIVFINQKLFSVEDREGVQGHGGPLPTLFIGSEKTQIRQIPLTDRPPWPFKFLLELGGSIVCRPENYRDFILALRQFMSNYPQVRIEVDLKEWPDGSIYVHTWWFETVGKR